MTKATKPRWSPEWSNDVFSVAERDLRWGRVRKLMRAAGVDLIVCLTNTNAHGRGSANHRYLTQLGDNSEEQTVAFPLEGEVTAWHSRGGVWPSSNWFDDIRPTPRGCSAAALIAWMNERGSYASARVAIGGLTATDLVHVRAREGEVNHASVEMLKQAFPKCEFVSASEILGAARYVKSAEEIEFLRKGTRVAEQMIDALVATARPGVRERHVFAQMMYASAEAGGTFTPMIGWVSGPRTAPYHRLEQPTTRAFGEDDILSVEVEGRWGGHIAQLDQTCSLGKAHPETLDAHQRAIEAYDRVMTILKPGITVRELIAAARTGQANSQVWTGLGAHGRGTGDDGPLIVTDRQLPEVTLNRVIEAGCAFAIKPYTYDGQRELARWGETIAVTANGAERLGVRAPVLHQLV
ncbi:MAG: M24 family metallopeptidase [Candidatus Lustribacter sp.]|jgi:Xaa-Pro aminopeptidase